MLKLKEFSIRSFEEDTGYIEGYASTWIREPDVYGDVVKQGAFQKSLEKIKAEGKKIPLIWSHQLDNLKSYIGEADAFEDEKGLHFIAKFNDSDEAQKVRNLYKDGLLSKFSFAYNVLDEGTVTLDDGRKANELRELEIYEISCVLVPANSDAGIIDVKTGKRNSSKDEETIKNAIELLKSLLENIEDSIEENNADEKSEKVDSDNGAPEDQGELNEKKEALLELIKKIKI